jgi:hypothetical protein
MSLPAPGKDISGTDILNISRHGIWLYARGKEYFLPFEQFPWFRDKPVSAIFEVVELSPGHFYWPRLDIDLSEEIMEHPERFPLVADQTE